MQKPERKPSDRRIKRKRKNRRIRLFLASILLVFLIAIGTSFAFFNEVDQALDQWTSDPFKLPGNEKKEVTYQDNKPLSFVIFGTDNRKKTGSQNTDVLIVAVVNPATQKMTMVSLPRDTRVKIPGYKGYHKINEVYASGEAERRSAESKGQPVTENGVTLLKKTLTEMLGIPVDHYVKIDFEGFKGVINELDGIEVTVDRDLKYNDPSDGTRINLKKGRQLLDGEQALGYVRHRLDSRGDAYQSSDFDRNRRQQEVIKAVTDKIMSVKGVASIFDIIGVVGNHLHTDLSKDQIKGLAMNYRNFSSESIISLENGAVWNSIVLYTLIPNDKMQAIRSTLQQEMGTTTTAKLDDAAIAEFASTEVAVPSKGKKTTQTTKSSKATNQKTETKTPQQSPEQNTTQNPTQPSTPPPDSQESVDRPPDIPLVPAS
ncbi:LCP family protein [Brevibacillus sp. SYSU BS000544]|uniref:LCP family protein n=1 Tax=Brevibacillus sp. SYSU BS000544 TaxID=3416443 RepID=UPI003CE4A0D8